MKNSFTHNELLAMDQALFNERYRLEDIVSTSENRREVMASRKNLILVNDSIKKISNLMEPMRELVSIKKK